MSTHDPSPPAEASSGAWLLRGIDTEDGTHARLVVGVSLAVTLSTALLGTLLIASGDAIPFEVVICWLACGAGVLSLLLARLTRTVEPSSYVLVFMLLMALVALRFSGVAPPAISGVLLGLLPMFSVVVLGPRRGMWIGLGLMVGLLVGGPELLGSQASVPDLFAAVLVVGTAGTAAWWYEVARQNDRRVLEQQATDLEQARDEAELAGQLRLRFLANISHEIRTPMNGVLGVTRVLLDTDLSDEQRNLGQTIERSGGSLLQLLNDLLDLSKIESGHIAIDEDLFEPRLLVEDVAALFAETAHSKGIELIVLIDAGLPRRLTGDAQRVRQILSNLVSNAVKFSREGDVVVHATWRRDDGFTVSVRDTGPGIPADDLDRIFEPFVQAESTRRATLGGTGLGLAVSRQLAWAMDGDLHVESAVGRGSRFWLQVPLDAEATGPMLVPEASCRALVWVRHPLVRRMVCDAIRDVGWIAVEPDEDHAGQLWSVDAVIADLSVSMDPGIDPIRLVRWTDEPPPHLRALRLPVQRAQLEAVLRRGSEQRDADEEALGAGARVLVVEDNHVNQLVARRMLEKQGHHVATAENGAEALEALEGGVFDLVLMDVQMPVMDGLEATRELRRRGLTMPVVALTGYAMEQERHRCLAVGMDDVLTKPVDADALEAVAQRAVREGGRRWRGQADQSS